jgi:hypothetical protein
MKNIYFPFECGSKYVKFQILKNINAKIIAFWNVRSSSLVDWYKLFGETYYLHLQGEPVYRYFGRTYRHVEGRRFSTLQIVCPKRSHLCTKLHGVISQKAVISNVNIFQWLCVKI